MNRTFDAMHLGKEKQAIATNLRQSLVIDSLLATSGETVLHETVDGEESEYGWSRGVRIIVVSSADAR